MKSDYKYCFLGFGPSNLFSVLNMVVYEGVKGEDIIVIDKGPNPIERKEKDLLYGFGGAGFWSDGKYVFNSRFGVIPTLSSHVSTDLVLDRIKNLITKFYIHDSENVKIREFPVVSEDKLPSYLSSFINNPEKAIEFQQSYTIHVGSDKNKILGETIYKYLLEKGVTFRFGKEIEPLSLHFRDSYIVADSEIGHIMYDYLQIGVGKAGSKFIEELCFLNKINTIVKSFVHVGGRLETKMTNRIREISSIQKDFKLISKYNVLGRDVELRTFCVNTESAYVVQEVLENRIQYNGHGYSESRQDIKNDLCNFGVMMSLPSEDVKKDIEKYIFMLGNSIYLAENFDISSSLRNISYDKAPCILCGYPFPKPLFGIFKDFINKLDELFQLEQNFCIFFPEIKVNPGLVDVNDNFVLRDGRFPNVTWVGDSCVGTRGIVPSAISGILAMKNFI